MPLITSSPAEPPAVAPRVKHLTSRLFLPDRVRPIDVHRWTQPERNPAHDHDFVEMALVLEGRGVHEAGQGESGFGPGDFFVIRPGVWHRYAPEGGERGKLKLYNLLFDTRYLRRELGWLYDEPAAGYLLTAGAGPRDGPRVLQMTLAKAAAKRVESLMDGLHATLHPGGHGAEPAADPSTDMIDALGRLLMVFAELTRHFDAKQQEAVRQAAQVHPAVQLAIRLLEEELRRPWTLAELGKAVHLDPGYLVKLFGQTVGTPPIAYLNEVRCDRASALLRRTPMTAAEIGVAVGFDDPNYFSRRFKAHFGQSPTAFRRANRGEG